ncbi:hypothetical protein [Candidatus Nitrosocosmicus franklandus]|uniref:hypothetical protein n=1 Tax=Candidatus Nitrosocosmicus franklandianus TaxID=1798806 RepID=UPI00106CEF29|nr:hypothetical protein [Candidatus Nitrosocosmicus franklandus]
MWTVESLLLTLVDSKYSVGGPKSLIYSKSVKGVSSLYNGTSNAITFCQAEAKVFSDFKKRLFRRIFFTELPDF